MEELMNVDKLSEEEKLIILRVIKRDEELRKAQDTRVSQLKTEIHNLRMQSILREGDDLSKICARCHKPFGFFFNTGDICSQCKFRVCSVCRESLLSGKWLCILCYKHIQLKGLTGEWIYGDVDNEQYRKSQSGADVVKASLRKSLSTGNVSTKPRDRDGGDGAPDSKRTLVRNSSASQDDLDRVGFPKETDKKRLSSLFDSFRSSKDELNDEQYEVKHVSCRRHRDSDSDSDSGSSVERESPMDVADAKPQSTEHVLSASAATQNLSETESASEPPKDQRVSSQMLSDVQVPNQEEVKRTNEAGASVPDELSQQSPPRGSPPMTPTEAVIAAKKRSGEPDNLAVHQEESSTISPVSPTRNAVQTLEHKPLIVRRTSSEKSDSSLSSARTASPATKMRLLDLASKRALERESFDQEESGNDSPRQKNGDTLINEVNRRHMQHGQLTNGSSLGRHVSPQVKVTSEGLSDETESHGGDSGHISGTSAENTPEHRSRSPRHSHLSIPSLAMTSTSAEEQASQQDEEDDEDIDKVVATHKSFGSLRGSYGNLHSNLADSRESLYSVYSDAGEVNYGKIPVTGEILFGLDYNYKTGALEIYIKQCKEIAPVDTRRNRSDPYVKTYLLPDRTRGGKRKTKIKKHTLNPTFDEVLRYVISKSEVENRVLWVTVWHSDRFGRNDFLGEVLIPLDCYKFGDSTPVWYPLQERLEAPSSAPVSYKGDLVLSVKYVTPENIDSKDVSKKGKSKKTKGSPGKGELQVLIKEARNLSAVRSNGSSDPFCKAYLLPEKNKTSKQKTPVVKRNCNPTWNHVFLFEDISLAELKDRSLELTVWDYDKITSNDFLGGIRLNLGTGVSGGRKADWMDARGEEIAIWQSTIDRPNCWNDATVGLRASMGKSEIRN